MTDWTVKEVEQAKTILKALKEKPGVYGAVLEMVWKQPVAARWKKMRKGLWQRASVPEKLVVAQVLWVKRGGLEVYFP